MLPCHISRVQDKVVGPNTDADLTKPVIAAGSTKGMQVSCALVQLQYASAHRLHEGSVMGHQNESCVAAGQPCLHPFDGLQTAQPFLVFVLFIFVNKIKTNAILFYRL